AYDNILPPESFPLYVLFIEIDPAKIDINVHPTKTEIKYEDERAIYAIIQSAVKRSLGRYNITPTLDFNQETGFSQLISQKPLGEIVPPTIAFNPNFNPFERESEDKQRGGRPISSEKSGIPANWDTLYQITRQASDTQLSLHSQESGQSTEDQLTVAKH